MKKAIIFLMLAAVCCGRDMKPDRDRMIIRVDVDASAHDIELFEGLVHENIDPQYVCTNSVVYVKNDNPKKGYYVTNFDPLGRGDAFTADDLLALIHEHSAEFDKPNDFVVLKNIKVNGVERRQNEIHYISNGVIGGRVRTGR